MGVANVKRGRVVRDSAVYAELLEEYTAACTRVNFEPPLSFKESTLLQNLQLVL